MAAERYTKGEWIAEADVRELPDGRFQGVVRLVRKNGSASQESQHVVEAVSDSPDEALEEAKALAHRLLADR